MQINNNTGICDNKEYYKFINIHRNQNKNTNDLKFSYFLLS